jgi:SWI/SNF-related matrix-associated actin-dependent regulator 1 of chromatin subfamily A
LPAARSIVQLQGAAPPQQADLYIVSYASLPDYQEALSALGLCAIVADESHYLKNRESKRTQAILSLAAKVTGLRFCLSGMSLPEQPVELATQLELLGLLETELGGFWAFAERYCAPRHTDYGTVFGAENMEELAQRLRSRGYCRREKQAVLSQLPAKMQRIVSIALEDRQAYEAARDECLEGLHALALADAERGSERDAANEQAYIGVIQRLLQACGQQKIAGMGAWIARFVARAEPLIVVAEHRDVIEALQARFPHALSLTGAHTALERDRALQAFRAGETALLICARAVMSRDIASTAQLVIAELGWEAADYAALEGRTGFAEASGTSVCYLVAEGTIDDLVMRALSRKRERADAADGSVLREISHAIARRVERRRRPRSTRHSSREPSYLPVDADTPRSRAGREPRSD